MPKTAASELASTRLDITVRYQATDRGVAQDEVTGSSRVRCAGNQGRTVNASMSLTRAKKTYPLANSAPARAPLAGILSWEECHEGE
jgi:hypothetical protein